MRHIMPVRCSGDREIKCGIPTVANACSRLPFASDRLVTSSEAISIRLCVSRPPHPFWSINVLLGGALYSLSTGWHAIFVVIVHTSGAGVLARIDFFQVKVFYHAVCGW